MKLFITEFRIEEIKHLNLLQRVNVSIPNKQIFLPKKEIDKDSIVKLLLTLLVIFIYILLSFITI